MKSHQIQEVEFKWSVRNPSDFETFLNTLPKYAVSISSAKKIHIKDYYLDTSSRFFGKCRTSCRLRNYQNKWELTFKSQNALKKGLASRQEKTIQLQNFRNIEKALDYVSKKILTPMTCLEPIEILFEIDNQRTVRNLTLSRNTCAELSFDETLIRRGRQAIPLMEIELEFLRGDEKVFGVFIEKMTRRTKILPASISKVATALTTFGLKVETPGEKTFSFTRHDSLNFAVLQTVKQHVQNIQILEPAVRIGMNPEAVHLFRIAFRKLRSVLILIKKNLPQENHGDVRLAKNIGRKLGQWRDWQTHSEKMTVLFKKHHIPKVKTKNYFSYVESQKQNAYRNLLKELNTKSYLEFIHRLSSLKLEAGEKISDRLIEIENDCLKKPGKAALKVLKKTAMNLHLLRLRIKKLRYACEFFEQNRDKKITKAVAVLILWQEKLGKIQDIETQIQFLNRFQKSKSSVMIPGIRSFLKPLLRSLEEKKDEMRQKICGRSNKTKKLWKFIKNILK